MALGVDVVVPTFKRPEALARCLEALEKQTVAPDSIQVVDDSSRDKGPAYSRNIGLSRGTAPIVAFTDDDCVPSRDWIASIQQHFLNKKIHGMEGVVTTVGPDGKLSNMNPNPKDKWNRFKTANMAFRRSALEEVGGFDERYYIHREDTDLAWRIINSGRKITWSPKCIVHHPDRGGMARIAYDSEQLLYRSDPKKYVEVAAASISIPSIFNGEWRINRKAMRKKQRENIQPLTNKESVTLWLHAFLKAIIRKITHS